MLLNRGGADAQALTEAFGDSLFVTTADEDVTSNTVKVSEGNVGSDGHRQSKAGPLAVFRDERDAGSDSILR